MTLAMMPNVNVHTSFRENWSVVLELGMEYIERHMAIS
jgi:hypothetical protein